MRSSPGSPPGSAATAPSSSTTGPCSAPAVDIDLSGYRVEVTVPEGIAVSTADAYRGIVPQERKTPLRDILSRPIEEWKDLLVNDFEATVFAKYPRLAEIKQSLYAAGAVYAAMSGSGSALFAIYRQ